MLGLGPGGEESYVRQLLANGAIERGYAALDLYQGDQSQITFGKIDY